MFDLSTFLKTFSYLGVFIIIYSESGLLFGLIFPGDSLLFLAGALAAQHFMNLAILLATVLTAAIFGNLTGYWIGHTFGPGFFNRSKILTKDQLKTAENFFTRHGGKAVILGRFVPVVRTIVPLLAGVGSMEVLQFNLYNIAGAMAWGGGITMLGYFLGTKIPNIDKYILPVIVLAVAVTAIPSIWHLRRNRRKNQS